MAEVEGFRLASGKVLTEEDAKRIADEVESEDPVVFTGVRLVGRPSLEGNGTSPRLNFRVPRDLYEAASKRAIEEDAPSVLWRARRWSNFSRDEA